MTVLPIDSVPDDGSTLVLVPEVLSLSVQSSEVVSTDPFAAEIRGEVTVGGTPFDVLVTVPSTTFVGRLAGGIADVNVGAFLGDVGLELGDSGLDELRVSRASFRGSADLESFFVRLALDSAASTGLGPFVLDGIELDVGTSGGPGGGQLALAAGATLGDDGASLRLSARFGADDGWTLHGEGRGLALAGVLADLGWPDGGLADDDVTVDEIQVIHRRPPGSGEPSTEALVVISAGGGPSPGASGEIDPDDAGAPRIEIRFGPNGWSVIADAPAPGVGLGELFDHIETSVAHLLSTDGVPSAPTGDRAELRVVHLELRKETGPGGSEFHLECELALDLGDLSEQPIAVELSAVHDGEWRLSGSFEADSSSDDGIDLEAVIRRALAAVRAPDLDVDLDGARLTGGELVLADDVHLSLRGSVGSVDVGLDLWREEGSWRPLLQAGAAELPSGLPLPDDIVSLFHDTSLRWSSRAEDDVPLVGGDLGSGPVAAGLTFSTVLDFGKTSIGRALGVEDDESLQIPIALEGGELTITFSHELLPGDGSVSVGTVEFTSLLVEFRSPASLEVRIGCDIEFELADSTTELRFAGAVRADLTERDVSVGVGFLGEVGDDGEVRPWSEPFGFPGLAIGHLEAWIGTSTRAFRGAVSVGRSSLDIRVVQLLGSVPQMGIRFAAESLTVGELVSGLSADPSPALPAPIAESGFREIALDFATAPGIEFEWLDGSTWTPKPGLFGHARLALLGLDMAVAVEIDRSTESPRVFVAGVMESLDLGIVRLTRSDGLSIPEPTEIVQLRGKDPALDGPWALIEVEKSAKGIDSEVRAGLNAKLVLFGVLEKAVEAELDDDGLEVLVDQRLTIGDLIGVHSNLRVRLGSSGTTPDFEVGGSLDVTVKINPRALLAEVGVDVRLPDMNIVDIEASLDVEARFRDGVLGGSISARAVLWGAPISFSLGVDLDLNAIGDRVLQALKDAALAVINVLDKVLKAVEHAVAAAIEVIEEVGQAVVQAFEDLGRAIADVGRALEQLGRIIEELAEAVAAEILSWFGDDRLKRRLEADKRRAELTAKRAREKEQAERARTRRLERERQLYLVEMVENLADAAMIDPSRAAGVQLGIDRCDRTRVNPFTERPEVARGAQRARNQAMWDAALGRARSREALRDEYEAALDAANARIDDAATAAAALANALTTAREDLASKNAALADARTKFDEVDDKRKEALAALNGARDEMVKAEIALDHAESIEQQIDTARTRDRALVDVASETKSEVDGRDTSVEVRAAGLRSDLGWPASVDAAAQLDDARSAAAAAGEAVARAESDLASAEAELLRLRAARRVFTLARFEMVRSSLIASFGASDVFQAWLDAVEVAGDPARVASIALRAQVAVLLDGIPAASLEAAGSAAELAATSAADERDEYRSAARLAEVTVESASSIVVSPWDVVRDADDKHRILEVHRLLRPDATAESSPAPEPVLELGLSEWRPEEQISPASLARRLAGDTVVDRSGADDAFDTLIAAAQAYVIARMRHDEARLRDAANTALAERHAQVQDHVRALDHWERVEADVVATGERVESSLGDAATDPVIRSMFDLITQATAVDLRRLAGLVQLFSASAAEELRTAAADVANASEQLVASRSATAASLRDLYAVDDVRAVADTLGAVVPTDDAESTTESLAAVLRLAEARLDEAWTAYVSAERERTIAVITAQHSAIERARAVVAGDVDGAALMYPGAIDVDATTPERFERAHQSAGDDRDVIGRASRALPELAGDDLPSSAVEWSNDWARRVVAVRDAAAALHHAHRVAEDAARVSTPASLRRWRLAALGLVTAPRLDAIARRSGTAPEVPAQLPTESFDALADITKKLHRDLAAQRALLDGHVKEFSGEATDELHVVEARLTVVAAELERLDGLLDEQTTSQQQLVAAIAERGSTAPLGEGRWSDARREQELATTHDERRIRQARDDARSALGEVTALAGRAAAVESAIRSIESRITSAGEAVASVDRELDALGTKFDEIAERAGESTKAIADLLAKIQKHVGDLEKEHRTVVGHTVEAIEAAFTLARLSDDVELDDALLSAVAVAIGSIPSADEPPPNEAIAVAPVDQARAELQRATNSMNELASDLVDRSLDAAAELTIVDPAARRRLEADHRSLEAAHRERLAETGASVVDVVVPTIGDRASSVPAGERRASIPQLVPTLGATFAARVRLGGSASGTSASRVLASPVDVCEMEFDVVPERDDGWSITSVVALDGDELLVIDRRHDGERAELARLSLPTARRVDLAVVVRPDGIVVVWVDGRPVAHRTVRLGRRHDRLRLRRNAVVLRREDVGDADVRGVEMSDLRVWDRSLDAPAVAVSARRRPDPRDVDLAATAADGRFGRRALERRVRRGVPDGCVLLRTDSGDLITSDRAIELPDDLVSVHLGDGAAVMLFGAPDGTAPLGPRYLDLDAETLRTLRCRSVSARPIAETLGAQRWVLDVVDHRDRRRIVAAERTDAARLRVARSGELDVQFRLATTPTRSGSGRLGLTAHAVSTGAPLRLDDRPNCAVETTDTGPVGPAGATPRDLSSAGDVALRDGHLVVDAASQPEVIELDVAVDTADATGHLLRFHHAGRPHDVQLVAGRVYVVADDAVPVGTGETLRVGAVNRIRIDASGPHPVLDVVALDLVPRVPAGPPTRPRPTGSTPTPASPPTRFDWDAARRVRPRRQTGPLGGAGRRPSRRPGRDARQASKPARSAARAEQRRTADRSVGPLPTRGAIVAADSARRLGRLSRMVVRWAGADEATDVTSAVTRGAIRLGVLADPLHRAAGRDARPVGGLTADHPVRLGGAWTLSAWVRSRSDGRGSVIRLVDERDRTIVEIAVDRPAGGRPALRTVVGTAADVSPAPSVGRRHHVALLATRHKSGLSVAVVVDGERRGMLRTSTGPGGPVRIETDDAVCAVEHLALFDRRLESEELAGEILRPSLDRTPAPLARWQTVDGDVGWDDRGAVPMGRRTRDRAGERASGRLHALIPAVVADPAGVLHAEAVTGRGRVPRFRLSQHTGGRTRWMALSRGRIVATDDPADAAELGLRAVVVEHDHPSLGPFSPVAPVASAGREEASPVDPAPVDVELLRLRRSWDEARTEAIRRRAVDGRRRADDRRRAIATARRVLARVDLEIDPSIDADGRGSEADLERLTNDIRAMAAAARRDRSGLAIEGPGQRATVPFLARAPLDELTISYWIRRHHPTPDGRLITFAPRDGAGWSVDHVDGGVRFAIGSEVVRVPLPFTDEWFPVGITWRSTNGEVIVSVAGSAVEAGRVAVGARLSPIGTITVGDPESSDRSGTENSTSSRAHVEQVAVAQRIVDPALMALGLHGTSMGDGVTWTLVQPDDAAVSGTQWRDSERGGVAIDQATPPSVSVIDRALLHLEEWERRLDRTFLTADPLHRLVAGVRFGTTVDAPPEERLAEALLIDGARPTRAALDWDADTWRSALASWRRGADLTVVRRRLDLERIGIDIRRPIGSSAAEASADLLDPLADRAATLDRHGWRDAVLGRSAATDIRLTRADAVQIRRLSAARGELRLRRLGYEPVFASSWSPAARLWSLAEAERLLEDPEMRDPDSAELRGRVRTSQRLLLPVLSGVADRDWFTRSLAEGRPIRLEPLNPRRLGPR